MKKSYKLAILVAALGYFVDIYDLLLFSIVRVSSLKAIGVPDAQLLDQGVLLINVQMAGLLLGGLFWGILGDKKGRLSVLFGSIFLYSVANLANSFVSTVEQYAWLRFFAGLGLAGELGAGITLVSELMPKEIRGYGTTVVASVGILGAVVAALVGDAFDWRTAYIIGGVMGLLLLALRVGVSESGMFQAIKVEKIKKGSFWKLFGNTASMKKYFSVILVGVPIWFTIGILVTFSPEFGRSFGMVDLPTAGRAVMYTYIGLSLGDLSSGLLSQKLKSRKKSLAIFLILLTVAISTYFVFARESLVIYYTWCGFLGFGAGYWAMFVTVASEQFGTNIRSTVTTTAPNFVRGAVIPLTMSFQALKGTFGVSGSAAFVGLVSLALAFVSLLGLEESFHKELSYLELH